MNRIEFVGNALFIPFFLIGVGMLIDFRAFFTNLNTIFVAVVMTVIATVAKFVAAWLTQKTFRFSVDQRRIIFGLSNAQAAATLAAVLVGYNIITGQTPEGEPIRLLNDAVLNGTIFMILITCTMATFVAQKGARNLAQADALLEELEEGEEGEKILIPLSNIDNVEELINISVTLKSSKQSSIYALNILNNLAVDRNAEKHARKLLELAEKAASATDHHLFPVMRYDSNVVNGITSVVQEQKISDLIIGLHQKKGITDSFLGNLTQGILQKCNTTTIIYRPVQPFATVRRTMVFVPDNAEKEAGFAWWLVKVWNIGKNTGSKLLFFGSGEMVNILTEIHKKHPVEAEFREFSDWDDFLILGREVKSDDHLVFILSRKEYPSYHPLMTRISGYINKYFADNNCMLIYPRQYGVAEEDEFNPAYPSMFDPANDNLERLENLMVTIGKIFRKK